MEVITSAARPIPCNHWSSTDDDSEWLTEVTTNLILGCAFTLSYFVEEPWIGIRLILVLGHAVAANLALNRCSGKAFLWALLLMGVNIYKLSKSAYNHRPSLVPSYLQEIYNTVFKVHNISRPDFAVLTEKSKLVGIGPYEPLYPDGQLRHDHIDLCVLISGKMTTWCDGLAIHNICPGQFINSVEWKSFLRVEEDQQDFGWQQQVLVEPDEDSMYLRIHGDHLNWIKTHRPDLWQVLDSIVCGDVVKKLYQMNDGFAHISEVQAVEKRKALAKHLVKSVSLEALNISSKGYAVTKNWLKAENRHLIMASPHDFDEVPMKSGQKRRYSDVNLSAFNPSVCSSVAYMLQNSHPALLRDAEENATVIPSLNMQANSINPDSCRFRDATIIRPYDWEQSMKHCGNCFVCKPLEEGDLATSEYPEMTHREPN